MASFHASGQVHLYPRHQGNKKIAAEERTKRLNSQSSEIQDHTIKIRWKYANRFFLEKDFGTALYFDSLQIKVLHCKLQNRLLILKSALENLEYVFQTVVEKDKYFSDNFPGFTSRFSNFQKKLILQVKTLNLGIKANFQTVRISTFS